VCLSLKILDQLTAAIVIGGGDITENEKCSNFQAIMTLTLTLHRVILHTVMHHSSTSTYMPNFSETEEMFCGWM